MKIQESFLPSFPFFHLLHWVRQPFLGIPPFISDPGSLCLFLYLDLHIHILSVFLTVPVPVSGELVDDKPEDYIPDVVKQYLAYFKAKVVEKDVPVILELYKTE